MADQFTTYCEDVLWKSMEMHCPSYAWWVRRSLTVNGQRVVVDVYGEHRQAERTVCVELEVHRGHPQMNAVKLAKADKDTELLVLHVFSPFYEHGTPRTWRQECETLLREGLQRNGISYVTLPWKLSHVPSVERACQVLPQSSNHFPPDNEIRGAIDELAKELKAHISDWEAQLASP